MIGVNFYTDLTMANEKNLGEKQYSVEFNDPLRKRL